MHREVTDYQIQHKWLPEQKNVALDHPKAQLKKKKSRQSVITGAGNDIQLVRFIIFFIFKERQ